MQKKYYTRIVILLSLLLLIFACLGLAASYLWELDFFGLEKGAGEISENDYKDGAMYLSEIERQALYELARQNLKAEKYAEYAVILQQLADDGYAPALFDLSGLYELGQVAQGGFVKNPDKAFSLCLAAAESGYGLAMIGVSRYYKSGYGTAPNFLLAFSWLKRAYVLKEAEAIMEMGFYYEQGLGVNQDYQQAAKYYAEAVEQGSKEGMANLGRLFCLGPPELRNIAEGMWLLQQAYAVGIMEACVNLGLLMEMSGELQAAFQFYSRAAEAANVYGYHNQARFLHYGFLGEVDLNGAFELYFKAADKGLGESIVALADLLASKKGNMEHIRRFHLLQDKILEMVEQQGHTDLQRALADLLLIAEEVFGKDVKKAESLYEQAAASGDSFAMYRLGYGHEYNLFALSSLDKARVWYEQAINHNKEANSAYQLGLMYMQGRGVEKNPLQAYILLRTAIAVLGEGAINTTFIAELEGVLTTEQKKIAESLLKKGVNKGGGRAGRG